MAEKNEGSKLSSTWRPANDYVNLKVGKLYNNIHYKLFTKYSFFRKKLYHSKHQGREFISYFFKECFFDIIDLHSTFTGQLSGERRKSPGMREFLTNKKPWYKMLML